MSLGAKASFDANLQRAGYFLDIHEQGQAGAGAPTLKYRELPRGSVVFAVGALDAYLSDVSADVMIHQCRKGIVQGDTRAVMRKVNSELPALALELVVVEDENERVDRLRGAIVEHFQTAVSGFGAKAVATTVERMGGSPTQLWNDVTASGIARPAEELEFWTDVRHRIVHRGERVRVWRPRARDCINLLASVAGQVDKLAAKAVSDESSQPSA